MLVFALALLLPFLQQGTPPEISANKPILIDDVRHIRRAEGDVIVLYEDLRVEADWLEWNDLTNQITAGDHVKFVRGEEELRGSKLSFNLTSKTGTLSQVSGRIEGYFVRVKEAERLEDGTWNLMYSTITACEDEECPGYAFNVKEAFIEPGKRVRGKNTVFRFEGVPVFFLPYVVVPTTTRERSSGFLMPTISKSTTKGRSFRGAFYWAPDRSYDATFSGEYFSERGPAGTIDFRAAPKENSKVAVSTFFVFDRKKQGGLSTNILGFTDIGKNWRGVADVTTFSSFEFRQVFDEGFNVISSPIEQSLAFLANNGKRSSTNILYNRSAIFYTGQPSVALRKFPSVDYSLTTNSIGRKIPVYFSMGSSVTGEARRDGTIDTPPFMQRVDLQPAIEIPLLSSSIVQWSHRISLRDTLYTHSLNTGVTQNILNRAAFDYTMRITGPQLQRDFKTWRHIIEPSVKYRYVAGIDRFRQTIIVDEVDLMSDTNEIEYAITNRFMAGHEFLSWRVAQKLYMDPTFGGALVAGRRNTLEPLMDLTGYAFSDGTPRRFSPLVSTFRIATTPQTSTDIQVDYDTVRNDFRSAGIMGELNRASFYSSIAYFFNKSSAIQSSNNQLRAMVLYGAPTKPGISAGLSFYYDVSHSLLQGSTAQVSYNSECYGLSFEFTQYDIGARKESRFRFALTLKNLGSVGTLRRQERLF